MLVELRCKRKGHRQANIYPTSRGPLLVAVEDNDLSGRGSSDGLMHADGGPRRNPHWILPAEWYEVVQADVPGGAGSMLLLGWPGMAAMIEEWAPDQRPSRLLCRCGSTALPPLGQLEAAAEEATRTNRTGRVFTV